ncbi:MAG: hypothetical protein H7X97_11475 [Opitutaceae bacterium]|nr:hypothetical protein [Verrucomicrobiales bacterium]
MEVIAKRSSAASLPAGEFERKTFYGNAKKMFCGSAIAQSRPDHAFVISKVATCNWKDGKFADNCRESLQSPEALKGAVIYTMFY